MQVSQMAAIARRLPGQNLPHLAGVGASLRQVFAAHFVRDCDHILEIGGHIRPVTDYITHAPASVTSVDPKTEAFDSETLNGKPCRVRHIPRKFQEVEYDYVPGSYGLVLLGYSLKPFGNRDPLGELFFSLIDNAKVVVLEYSPALERATSQVPHIISRPSINVRTMIDIRLSDPEIADTPYADRRLYVIDPVVKS